jgi:hypothetical protein
MPNSFKSPISARKGRSRWIALHRFVVRMNGWVIMAGGAFLLSGAIPLIRVLIEGVPLSSTHSYVSKSGYLVMRPYNEYVYWVLAGVLLMGFGLLLFWIAISDRFTE